MEAKIRSQSLVGILHSKYLTFMFLVPPCFDHGIVVTKLLTLVCFTDSDMKIDRSLLTDQGVPIITVNNGHTYTYNTSMAAW